MEVVAIKNPKDSSTPTIPPKNPKPSCMLIKIVVRANSFVETFSVRFQDSPKESITPLFSNIINKGNNPRRPYK